MTLWPRVMNNMDLLSFSNFPIVLHLVAEKIQEEAQLKP